MPSTFTVISLGVLPDIDTFEGNDVAENAGALVGLTFGGPTEALLDSAVTWSPVTVFDGVYDMDGFPTEQFSINGGPAQTFDGTSIYNATITYLDGTTADITAVVAQDVDGNTYLMPEFSDNPDQAALEAGPIQSITFNSVNGDVFSGLTAVRETWDLVTCFTTGTLIQTNKGRVAVENLQPATKSKHWTTACRHCDGSVDGPFARRVRLPRF